MTDPLQTNERQEESAQECEETELRGIDKFLHGAKKLGLFEPGGARKLVLGQGKPFIYMSKDRTKIVTEYPDGRIESEPLKNPVPERRPTTPKENV